MFSTERIEHHVAVFIRKHVLMHPNNGIRRNRRDGVRAVGLVTITQHLCRVGIALGRTEDLRIGHRLPSLLTDTLLHILDIHRTQPDEIGAGVDRVRPIRRWVVAEVFTRDKRHVRTIPVHVPLLMTDHHALNFGILESANDRLKPRHGMRPIAGQPVLQQRANDLGARHLRIVRLLYRIDGDDI